VGTGRRLDVLGIKTSKMKNQKSKKESRLLEVIWIVFLRRPFGLGGDFNFIFKSPNGPGFGRLEYVSVLTGKQSDQDSFQLSYHSLHIKTLSLYPLCGTVQKGLINIKAFTVYCYPESLLPKTSIYVITLHHVLACIGSSVSHSFAFMK